MHDPLDLLDETLRTGFAFDLTRGPAVRADDLPDAEEIEGLTLYVNRRTDLRSLPPLPRLRALSVSGTPAALPTAPFPALEYYDGPVFRGALESEVLRWFYCMEGRTGLTAEHVFSGPVEIIRVNGDRSTAAFPQLRFPDALRWFDAWRYASLDLDGVQHCANLSSINLSSIARVQSADQLSALRELEGISLERVLDIEPMRSVHDWRARQNIAVIHKHPFDPERRDRLVRSDAPWTFPPAPSFYVAPLEAADSD